MAGRQAHNRSAVTQTPVPERTTQEQEGPIRTTVILPADLYWRVSEWAARNRKKKGDGIVELVERGFSTVNGSIAR